MSTPTVLPIVDQQGIERVRNRAEKKIRILAKLTWTTIIEGDLGKLQQIGKHLDLLNSGFSKIKINKYGWTPLHAACYFG